MRVDQLVNLVSNLFKVEILITDLQRIFVIAMYVICLKVMFEPTNSVKRI